MNIGWVLADATVLDPTQDLAVLKNIGSFWGSWRTWRACATDNVLCHDMKQADALLTRQFQKQCNFYIPNDIYVSLNRPDGVKLYEGKFMHDIDRQEEIVAMHLAAGYNDIVLLLGFDLQDHPKNSDKLTENRIQHYRNLQRQVIVNNPNTQWVLVDHPGEIGKSFASLENCTKDSMSSVITMLAA
jgi:hypothetical protein